MESVADALVFGLERSQKMINRYVADLTPEEYLHRPCPKANCVAWLLGHLTNSDRRALIAFGTEGPALPEGFEHRFSREAGCPEAETFGDVTILLPLFNDYRSRLIDKVKASSLEVLNRPLPKPHPMMDNLAEMAAFFAVHTSIHAGQMTIIRRSLGRPPLI